ncbi:MAG: GldG family protein [Clostridia bacterium]|nr:GldG family protein [Clostridia bacterium]
MNKKDNLDEEIMNTAEETEETLEDIEDVTEEYVPKAETEAETDDNTEIAEKKDKKSDKEKKSGIVKEFFKSRKFRKGGLSIAFTALFVVVIIVINMIAGLLTTKIPALTFDLSAQNTYELTQDTIDFIKTLKKEVTVTVLASESQYMGASEYYLMAGTLLKQYENYTDKIKIKYVDLTANPTFTNKYPDDTLSAGNYIVECGDKHRVLKTDDLFETSYDSYSYSTNVTGLEVEPAVTTAILNVTSDNQTKVQFIDGFGDYSSDAAAIKNLLEQNNYNVSAVNTLTQDIDSDTSAIILFTPTKDLDDTSLKKIKNFLSNNGSYGKNLIYVAPPVKTDTPKTDALLEEWGMKLGDGIVAETDTSKLLTNEYVISILDYSNTEYTEGLKNKTLNMVGGYIVPVEIKNANTATALLQTSAQAKLIPFDANSDKNFDFEKLETKQYNAVAAGKK